MENAGDILKNLALEREVHDFTHEDQARKIFRENVSHAAYAICEIAMHSENERIRLDASKYVVERVLGRTTDQGLTESIEDQVQKFLTGVVGP